MQKYGRIELILCFLLGVGVFAFYEAIGSFQAANCSYQQQYSRQTAPADKQFPVSERPYDGHGNEKHSPIREPFVCSIYGFPTAARLFADRNEGFVVGLFTMLLVFATAWLVRATNTLWQGAEDTAQRQLRAYVLFHSGSFSFLPQSNQMQIQIVIRNFGQTPANEVLFYLRAELGFDSPDFPFDPTIPADQLIESNSILPPHGDATATHFLFFDRWEQLALQSGHRKLFVGGHVTYKDGFNKIRLHKFRLSNSDEWYGDRWLPKPAKEGHESN